MLSETEEKKPETVTLTITLPTKEAILKKLGELFPGIEVKVEGEGKPTEESTTTE